MAGPEFGGRREVYLYFGDGLERMRNAVADSSEQIFLDHFGACVDFRVRCGVPRFLRHCGDDVVDLWCLFEYVVYTLATKKLRPATTESYLSAIKYLHRISRGVELETTHPVIASAIKGAARSHADAGNQISVRRPISWVLLLVESR